MNNRNTAYVSLRTLVELTLETQVLVLQNKKYIPPRSWINEFCTVKWGGPRRIGHTANGIRLLREDITPKPALWVAPRDVMIPSQVRTEELAYAVSILGIPERLMGWRCRTVIVDVSSLLSQSQTDQLLDVLAQGVLDTREQAIVLFLE